MGDVGLNPSARDAHAVDTGWTIERGEAEWLARADAISAGESEDLEKLLLRMAVRCSYKSVYDEQQPELNQAVCRPHEHGPGIR